MALLLFFFGKNFAQDLSLYIYGHDSLETKLIQQEDYRRNHSDLKSLQHEVEDFLKKMHQKGFINAQKTSAAKKSKQNYRQQIELGHQYESIRIFYDENLSPALLQQMGVKSNSSHFQIPFEQTENVLNRLTKEISNRGRPFSSLKLSDLKINEENELEAFLKIHFSGERKVDSILIKGYEKFPKSYLKNYVRIKKGQIFNKEKLDKKTEELRSLSFVSVSRNPEVLFTEDQTLLYLYLEKQNSNHFEGFLGFSTDEESQKLQLDGDISLDLINNLNYGEALSIHYKNTANDQQDFKAAVKLPYLFSTPIGMKLELNLFKQDSSYTINSQAVSLTYQINSKFELNATYKASASTDLLKNNLIGLAQEDYDAQFFILGGSYTNRHVQHPLFPIKTELNLQLGTGRRMHSGINAPQQYVEFSGNHLFELDMRNSIWISNKSYALFSENFLNNELARFGGIHSVRGFEENSLRASLFSSLQTEYRFLLSSKLYAHSIIDYAHFRNEAQNTKNNLYGIGFGLGLDTKAGLMNIAFANGKADGDSFKFENTKVHISLITSF